MRWGKKRSYVGAHVFITGGSTGIGLEVAKEFLRLQASVAIVARTQSKLDAAHTELTKIIKSETLPGKVVIISADVSVNENVKDAVKKAEAQLGPVSVAVAAAGGAFPGSFVDQDIELYHKSMQLDYFGSLYLAKAVVPKMLEQNNGQILFIASPLALVGITGFSTYCPAKAALRSLADVLRNELQGSNVKLSVGYPLDTDTPGLANENLTKPPEAEAIARATAGPVYPADVIAKSLVKGMQREQFNIKTPEFIINLLISAASNITPKPYFILLEMLWAPIVVCLLAGYGAFVDGIVKKERKKQSTNTSAGSSEQSSLVQGRR